MVAFNFKKDFVPKIVSGEKSQTIRQTQRCKPGDTMHLYTGQRTKDCQLIGIATCHACYEVSVFGNAVSFSQGAYLVTERDLHELAVQDGFADWLAFRDFFKRHYGLPFTGYIHFWRGFTGSKPPTHWMPPPTRAATSGLIS